MGMETWKKRDVAHIHVQHDKSLQRVQSQSHRRRRSSWMRRVLGQKVWSTPHNAIRPDFQLTTPFCSVTSWPCDELTGSHFSLHFNFPDRQRGWTQEPVKVENLVHIAIFGSFSRYRGDSIQRLRWYLVRTILDAVIFLSLMLNLALQAKMWWAQEPQGSKFYKFAFLAVSGPARWIFPPIMSLPYPAFPFLPSPLFSFPFCL